MYDTNILTFYNFVSKTPRDDAGVIHITAYHTFNLLFGLCIKVGVEIVGCLLNTPSVKGFVDNEHAQRVACLQESCTWWVVRGSQQIETCLFH